jgi:nucleoside-diphosphate-sugar epimerase
MRAIVSGASGCCGGPLIKHLKDQGCEVYTVGRSAKAEMHFPIRFPLDAKSICEIVQAVQPDYFFHLAGVLRSKDYNEYCAVNVNYAAMVIDAIKVYKPDCALLLVGSAAEYGYVTQEQIPVSESHFPNPKTIYGMTKWAQTQLGIFASEEIRHLVLARPFNIIGPKLNASLVLREASNQLADIQSGKRDKLTFGDIGTARDFVYVDDVVKIFWDLMNQREAHAKIINICSGAPNVIHDLIERMMTLSGIKAEIATESNRMRKNDTPIHYGDNSLLKSLIGYAPERVNDSALLELMKSSGVKI